MQRPSATVSLSNGNLNIQAPSVNGTSVLLIASPVAPVAGYGTVFKINTIDQAKVALGQVGNEAVLSAIVSGFYAEAPEGTDLYILCMAQTTTLASLMAAANAEKALSNAAGSARLLAAIKFPSNSYTPTVSLGFDVDVHNAVTAGQTLADAWFKKMQPFRFFIQGFGFTVAADVKDYSTLTCRNALIAIGSINDNSATVTAMAMGRAAAVSPERNIGRVKSGSLKIAEAAVVKIGAAKVEDVLDGDLNDLWTKRYITFDKNKIASGYVFSDDNTLTSATDDYGNLRNGRVMDNETRIAFATYYRELKDDVDVEEGGRLGTLAEKALENAVVDAVNDGMKGQLSKNSDGSLAVKCLVNPDPVQYAALYSKNNVTAPNFDVLSGGQVYLFVQGRPKGCLKYLNVFLGFTNE